MTGLDAIDTLGLRGIALGLADQFAAARAGALGVAPPDGHGVTEVVVLGMGGSGIGGDVLAAIARPVSPVPVVVVKDHDLPAFVSPSTLVVAASFSGNTAETNDAVEAAHAAGARLVTLSAGGRLAERARAWGASHVTLDGSIPMPRAAIAAVSVPPLVLLGRMGLLPGIDAQLDAAEAQLRRRAAQLAGPDSPARRLARRIGRTFPLVYGAGPVGAVAAYRWKCQVNENVKGPAFHHWLPEANHNELAGWGIHGDVTRQLITAVHLRHDAEPARVAASFGVVAEVQEEVVASVQEVRAEGDGPLAQLFDLVLVGDLVSIEMAAMEDIDPGPIPVLDDLKRRLG